MMRLLPFVMRMRLTLVPLRAQPGLHVRRLARRIEQRGTEQPVRRHLTMHRCYHGRAGIEPLQRGLQRDYDCRIGQVGLGQQQPVGDRHLLHGFRMFVELPPCVQRVDGRHHRIEPQIVAHHRIVQHHLHNRGRIGEADTQSEMSPSLGVLTRSWPWEEVIEVPFVSASSHVYSPFGA
jgi:hypothetical protein